MRKLFVCFLLLTFPLAKSWAVKPAPAPQTADQMEAIFKQCPAVATWVHQLEAKHKMEAPIKVVTLPVIRKELLDIAKSDQADRDTWVAGKKKGSPDEKIERDDADHLQRLKTIVKKHGALTTHMVGHDGVQAAWLLVQHADADSAFQARYLAMVKAGNTGLSKSKIALLTDRVLINQGRPQLYGTQFEFVHGELKLKPVEDRAGLAVRRASMGLMPLPAYLCFSKASYGIKP